MQHILSGVAALALIASPAFAQPGKDKNQGQGNGGGAMAEKGNGGAKQGPGNAGRNQQANANPKQQQSAMRADRVQNNGNDKRAERQVDRKAQGNGNGNGNGNSAERNERMVERQPAVRENRPDRRQDGVERRAERYDSDRRVTGISRDRRTVAAAGYSFDRSRNMFEGCPPGLAKKNNGCTPPGLAKKDTVLRNTYYRPDWFGYDGPDGRYFYDDGYLLRLNDRNSIAGFIPLLGGALSVGNTWPSFYEPVAVPNYYEQYFGLGAPSSYRYADNVIYQVDPQNAAITSIAALLTGDEFRVGQPAPVGYDVYNVPYGYREQYYDTPQSQYRYSDGYVYQIDPETRLVAAAIELLV